MILISHRGNINGPDPELENKPEYIDTAIYLGYDVEIDVQIIYNEIYLGHDRPQYKINIEWIYVRINKLWVHCKNIEAIEFFSYIENNNKINYFWHQEDTVTLTSKRYVWAFPGKQPIKNSIAVLPEIYKDPVNQCTGVCSDYISKYV